MAEPVRRCAGCGRRAGKTELIRVVRLPSGEVVFDPHHENQGRSLYFCPRLDCLRTLVRKKAPEKLMKAPLPANVREEIESHLSRAESEI
jgi:hypothetical protein